MKSLREQIAELENTAPRDFDPESIDAFDHGSDSDSEPEANGNADGREHYQAVEKSTLRKPTQPALGNQYQGSAVSRNALRSVDDGHDDKDPFAPTEDDGDSDPFARHAIENSLDDSVDEDISDSQPAEVEETIPADEDEEIDSDEAFGEGDSEKCKSFRFSASKSRSSPLGNDSPEQDNESMNGMEGQADRSQESDSATPSADDSEDFDDHNMDEDGSENNSEDEDEESVSSLPSSGPASEVPQISSDRAALKALLSSDTAAVASTLSAAANSDAKKGMAVKQQSQTLDRILDARIRLQKGVGVINSLPQTSNVQKVDYKSAIRKAEEAALTLWSTIETIRHELLDSDQSQPLSSSASSKSRKRKRPSPATIETSVSDLWARTQSLESATIPIHRAILDKWSAKTRAVSTAASTGPRSQLVDRSNGAQENSISRVLDTYLAAQGEKLFETATTSTNEIKTSSNPLQTPHTLPQYDDTTFYQTLLRDLISSRTTTTTTGNSNSTNALSQPHLLLPPKLHPSSSGKKKVDTRASKGRKVRYTVHEKLQNFMAAEGGPGNTNEDDDNDNDRRLGGGGGGIGTWGPAARREFFGSLLGGKMALAEGEEDEDEDEERRNKLFPSGSREMRKDEDEEDKAEGALRLF